MTSTTLEHIHGWHLCAILRTAGVSTVRNVLVDSKVRDLGKQPLVGAHRKLLMI